MDKSAVVSSHRHRKVSHDPSYRQTTPIEKIPLKDSGKGGSRTEESYPCEYDAQYQEKTRKKGKKKMIKKLKDESAKLKQEYDKKGGLSSHPTYGSRTLS